MFLRTLALRTADLRVVFLRAVALRVVFLRVLVLRVVALRVAGLRVVRLRVVALRATERLVVAFLAVFLRLVAFFAVDLRVVCFLARVVFFTGRETLLPVFFVPDFRAVDLRTGEALRAKRRRLCARLLRREVVRLRVVINFPLFRVLGLVIF